MTTTMSLAEFVESYAQAYIDGDIIHKESGSEECWRGRIQKITLKRVVKKTSSSPATATFDCKTVWAAHHSLRSDRNNWEKENFSFNYKDTSLETVVIISDDGTAHFRLAGCVIEFIPKPKGRTGPKLLNKSQVKGL